MPYGIFSGANLCATTSREEEGEGGVSLSRASRRREGKTHILKCAAWPKYGPWPDACTHTSQLRLERDVERDRAHLEEEPLVEDGPLLRRRTDAERVLLVVCASGRGQRVLFSLSLIHI